MSEKVDEREIERDLAAIETIKAQIGALNKQFESLELSVQEHERAIETLENYLKMKDEEILVPIGGGAFISAKVGEKKGMITIGSSLYTEIPIEDMIKKLKERKDDLNNMLAKISGDLTKLQQNYALLNAKVDEEYRKYLEERGNVQAP